MFFVFFFDVERGERAWSASRLPDAAVAGEQARDEKPIGRKGPSSKAPSRGGAAAEAGSAAVKKLRSSAFVELSEYRQFGSFVISDCNSTLLRILVRIL